MSELETCTFEELAAWSKGRWLADQHEASDQIKARAVALAKLQFPTKTVLRNEETGELLLLDDEAAIKKLEEEEAASLKAKQDAAELEERRKKDKK